MPKREGAFVPMESLSRVQRLRAEGVITSDPEQRPYEFQTYWYKHAGQHVRGKTVLDAGAGMGYGKRLLEAAGAAHVDCFDRVSLVPWVRVGDIGDYGDASYDWAVSMDVIEHVEDDEDFLHNLKRVAREGVFFSTPNWLYFKVVNEHHRREYTPQELRQLVERHGPWSEVAFFGGDAVCAITDRVGGLPDDDGACNFGVLLRK
jgi:2-polyprenyl-3-methyl-5-hydroxy-6-metoxy-1,4-benzoquinol methylase